MKVKNISDKERESGNLNIAGEIIYAKNVSGRTLKKGELVRSDWIEIIEEHPLSAARGILNGCIIGVIAWILIIGIIVLFVR
jgi:hypothetical protein